MEVLRSGTRGEIVLVEATSQGGAIPSGTIPSGYVNRGVVQRGDKKYWMYAPPDVESREEAIEEANQPQLRTSTATVSGGFGSAFVTEYKTEVLSGESWTDESGKVLDVKPGEMVTTAMSVKSSTPVIPPGRDITYNPEGYNVSFDNGSLKAVGIGEPVTVSTEKSLGYSIITKVSDPLRMSSYADMTKDMGWTPPEVLYRLGYNLVSDPLRRRLVSDTGIDPYTRLSMTPAQLETQAQLVGGDFYGFGLSGVQQTAVIRQAFYSFTQGFRTFEPGDTSFRQPLFIQETYTPESRMTLITPDQNTRTRTVLNLDSGWVDPLMPKTDIRAMDFRVARGSEVGAEFGNIVIPVINMLSLISSVSGGQGSSMYSGGGGIDPKIISQGGNTYAVIDTSLEASAVNLPGLTQTVGTVGGNAVNIVNLPAVDNIMASIGVGSTVVGTSLISGKVQNVVNEPVSAMVVNFPDVIGNPNININFPDVNKEKLVAYFPSSFFFVSDVPVLFPGVNEKVKVNLPSSNVFDLPVEFPGVNQIVNVNEVGFRFENVNVYGYQYENVFDYRFETLSGFDFNFRTPSFDFPLIWPSLKFDTGGLGGGFNFGGQSLPSMRDLAYTPDFTAVALGDFDTSVNLGGFFTGIEARPRRKIKKRRR